MGHIYLHIKEDKWMAWCKLRLWHSTEGLEAPEEKTEDKEDGFLLKEVERYCNQIWVIFLFYTCNHLVQACKNYFNNRIYFASRFDYIVWWRLDWRSGCFCNALLVPDFVVLYLPLICWSFPGSSTFLLVAL